MGLDEFSRSSTSVLQTRALLKSLDSKEMAKLAEKALNMDSNEEVKKLVEDTLNLK